MTPSRYASLLVAVVFLAIAATAVRGADPDCTAEPASVWAPAGWVCPPHYGIGTASTWGGPGAAVNSCSFPWTDCQTISVRSLDTGIVIIVTPSMWCHCWVGVTGPQGETERLVDLSPDLVAALGLPGPGLFQVGVLPVNESGQPIRSAESAALPDTAMGER